MNDQAACCSATLARRSYGSKCRADQGHVEVGILCYDDSVIPTQFQQAPSQPLCYRCGQGLTHSCAACCRNQWYPGVGADPFAHFFATHDQVVYSLWYTVPFKYSCSDILAG